MDLKIARILIFLLVFASQAVQATHSEIEPNDAMETANPYILGIPMSGQISFGEEDWFYFETLVDHLFLDISRDGELLNIEVFDSEGKLLYTGAGGESLIANIGLEKADTYFIRLRGNNSVYEFTARLSDEPVCDNCEALRGNNATFDATTGELFVRTVDVLDRYGKAVQYEGVMQLIPGTGVDGPMQFEVTKIQRTFK